MERNLLCDVPLLHRQPFRRYGHELSGAVAAVGQHYVEVGRKSALLSVGVDWILFPQSDRPSLEAVFTEIDAFLANTRPEVPVPVTGARDEGRFANRRRLHMKALVVDDDLMTRIVLQEILSGYAEVHSCVDGSEAVLAYRRALERGEPYDLVCMDFLMPVMGGIEALKTHPPRRGIARPLSAAGHQSHYDHRFRRHQITSAGLPRPLRRLRH